MPRKPLSALLIVSVTILLALSSCSTQLAPLPAWIHHPASSQDSLAAFDDALEQLALDAHNNLIQAGTRLVRQGKRQRTLWISKHRENGAQLWKLTLDLPGSEDALAALFTSQNTIHALAYNATGSYLVTLDNSGNQLDRIELPGQFRAGLVTEHGLLLAGEKLIMVDQNNRVAVVLNRTQEQITRLIPLPDGGVALIGNQTVQALKQGRIEWSATLPALHHGRRLAPSVLLSEDGFLYLAQGSIQSATVELHKLSLTGQRIWSLPVELQQHASSSPHLALTPAQNLLLFSHSSAGRALTAIDRQRGEIYLHRVLNNSNIIRSVISHGDRHYLFGGDALQTVNSEGQSLALITMPGTSPLTTGAALKLANRVIVANSFIDQHQQLRPYSASYTIN